MRLLLSLLCILLFASLASAQNESFGLDGFDDGLPLLPPSFNDGSAQKVAASGAILDQESVDEQEVVLRLRDDQGNQLSALHVQFIVDQGPEAMLYLENGSLSFLSTPGTHDILIMADVLGTPGNDYYLSTSLTIEQGGVYNAYLLPSGTLRARVMRQDKLVADADLNIVCSGNYGQSDDSPTNRFGAYQWGWLPVGSCTISATDGSYVGYAEVEIEHGLISTVDIELSVQRESSSWFLYALIILIVLAMVLLSMRSGKKKEHPKASKPKPQSSSRTDDLLHTLSPKERVIAEFLLKSHNYEATQAQIKNATAIPKTSLSRLLQSLEHKKLLKIEKIGKMKKAKITAFFLGIEEKGPEK